MNGVHVYPRVSSTVAVACAGVAVIASMVIAGWLLDVAPLGAMAGMPPTTMITAVAVLLSSAALFLLRTDARSRVASSVALACGVGVVAIGVGALLEHAGAVRLGLVEWFTPSRVEPPRMAPATSALLTATGLGLLLLHRGRVVASQWCGVGVGVLSLIALQARVYQELDVYQVPAYLALGVPAIAAFLLLSLGLLAARSHEGIAGVFARGTPGRLMGRRLWLPLMLLVLGGGVLIEWAQTAGVTDTGTGAVVMVTWILLLSSLLVWLNARSLNQLDGALRQTLEARTNAERILKRQASLFDQAYEAMVISQHGGPITLWNRGAEHLYGFTSGEAVGRLPQELLSTSVAGGIDGVLAKLTRDRHWEGELRHRHREGREIVVDTRMTLVVDDAGVFVVAASRDITERVRAEAALRESERRFREIAEWLPQLVWTCEPDGWCDYLSQRWLDYTGSVLEREVGYGWLEQIHPDDQAALMASWRASVETGTEFRIEFRIRRHDGVYRWFDTRALPLRDERGRIVKWFGSNTDIEGERASREALRSNEERLALALEINRTAAWDLDVATTHVRRTVEHDRIFGYDALQPVWTFDQFLAHIPPDERDAIWRRFERTLTSHVDDWSFDCRIRRLDGEIRWISVHGRSKRGEDGQVRALSGVVQDVTERKQIEEEIIRLNTELESRVEHRTRQLEAANRELEAFSYSVSHDLRAPLRTIDGFSQAVLEDFGRDLPAEGQRYLRIIREGAQRMGRLIDDLLAFSRLSRQPLTARPVDMHQLASDAWQEVSSQAGAGQVEVHIEILPPSSGDPSLLKQVWLNLLSNAVKYSRGRTPPRVHIGSRTEQGQVVYCVRDNGTGFDMQYAHKLFGVFQRLHRSEDFEGTGVGLAVVQRIIHRHGGQIWADATENQGATFFFTLDRGDTHGEQPSR